MIFNIQADPYQTDILFCLDASLKEVERHMRRHLKAKPDVISFMHDNLRDAKDGRCVMFDNGAILIFIPHKVVNALTMGLLVHEVYHAVHFILRRAGIKHSDHTEEAYAYLVQHLCELAFRRIGKRWWK